MRTCRKFIIITCVLTALTGFTCINALASVKVSIESHNKTLAHGCVEASTFREAVLKLCTEKEISVVFNPDGTEILSLNGISNNNFSVFDCWQGYILRGGTVMQSPDILNTELIPGDMLEIYYGHVSDTKIVTDFYYYEQNGKLNFRVGSSSVQWRESGGEWVSSKVVENLKNVRINITEPGGSRKIVQTNGEGGAESPLTSGGVYKFYAEGYRFNNNPSIVKTRSRIYFHSPTGLDFITRAEACAFFVQAFDLKPGADEKSFSDVNGETDYYQEIKTAASNNLVSGFETGEFRPDEPVNLLQLGIMLTKLYPGPDTGDTEGADEPIDSLPDWAQDAARKITRLGLFDDIGLNWMRPVTKDDLSALYETLYGAF